MGEKIYTEKRVNYNKRISRQNSVNRDLWGKANNKCVRNYTLSVGVHLVCVKILKYTQFCKDYTHCIRLLTTHRCVTLMCVYVYIHCIVYTHTCCVDDTQCTRLYIAVHTLCDITQRVSNYYTVK